MTGKVAELWRYPVSSMAGEQLAVARVEAGGIADNNPTAQEAAARIPPMQRYLISR